MARRMPAANGAQTNGNSAPPPSTLAAQIVQNQTTTNETATFAQLLNEILHNRAAIQETDINVNVQLVGVVLEAGLAPLAQDNPFAQWDVLVPQAVDSMAVIVQTISRQPEILFAQASEDGPQLSLTLLSRMIAVCGRPKCQDIPIPRVLDSLIKALQASLNFCKAAKTLQQICEACVEDALDSLEKFQIANVPFSFNLPPARTIAQLWPGAGAAIALPQGCQASVTSRTRAFMLAVELSQMTTLSYIWRKESSLRLQKLIWPLRSKLEMLHQWTTAVLRICKLPRCLPFLNAFLLKIQDSPGPSIDDQKMIASELLSIIDSDDINSLSFLLPTVQAIFISDKSASFSQDLQDALTALLLRTLPETQLPEEAFRISGSIPALPPLSSRARGKQRRRLSDQETSVSQSQTFLCLTKLLNKDDDVDHSALLNDLPTAYLTLPLAQQQQVWRLLEDLVSSEPGLASQLVLKLVESLDSRSNKSVRILSLTTIQSTVQRQTDPKFLDLSTSVFGKTCLAALHSSVRELRIAAGQCLPAFLREELPEIIRTENRRVALEYLRYLSDRDIASEHETLIAAWGQVARVCGDQELNLVLLRMVEYLGHSNSLVCALASAEIENIASVKQKTVVELCKPFWKTIAVSVVQDLHSRPQKAQQLCDLLEMNVNRFLLLTQRETIPTLVMTRKKDILQRIANARGNETSIRDLCMQPSTNLAAILALLVNMSTTDPEGYTMESLTAVAPDFEDTDFATLAKLEPVGIACEMLKRCGDTDPSRKSRAFRSFQAFVTAAERRNGLSKSSSKVNRMVADFFDSHILGILARFSDAVEPNQNNQSVAPTAEKVSCLRAIADMLTFTKEHASIALPQLRACLQSSMEQQDLVEAGFSAWLVLVSMLENDDLAIILDQTFALVMRHWKNLSHDLQTSTHEHIAQLIKTHNQIIQENIMTLPSLKGIPLLSKFAGEIERLRAPESVETHCKAFVKRLQDENRIVTLQALDELIPFLIQNQDFIHDAAISEQPPAILSDLLRAVLDTTMRYSISSAETADKCGVALGVIGCVDPNRVEAAQRSRRVVVLSNFDDKIESVQWAAAFLEDVLVKAFKSVTNGRSQGFIAYTMQELLSFCGFNNATVLRARSSQAPNGHQIWSNMPEHVRITLTPFLSSRYVVTTRAANKPPNRPYPSFSPSEGHTAWLRGLALDLSWRGKTDNARTIFSLIARIVRNQDLAIANYVLPYAILNVVLGGTVAEMKGISDEILAVLTFQSNDSAEMDIVRQCSETVFSVLDYMSTWLREKKKSLGERRAGAYKTGHSLNEFNEAQEMGQIETLEKFLQSIPAEAIASRATECGSYARALFHWEHYIRQSRAIIPSARMSKNDENLYERLQIIYAQIDEPDGLEGIGAHLSFLTEEQQVTQHIKAGRWTAAQAWYEIHLGQETPDSNIQISLLECLRETGQYAALVRYADSFMTPGANSSAMIPNYGGILPFALEALWETGDLEGLKSRLQFQSNEGSKDFTVALGQFLANQSESTRGGTLEAIADIRRGIIKNMTFSGTSSLQASHLDLKKLHTLFEIEAMENCNANAKERLSAQLDKRIAALGSYNMDKQFILGVRRAFMKCRNQVFNQSDLGRSWLSAARLARKSGNTHSAYFAVLRAYECGDKAAKLEEARLLWHDGHQRQAIQALEAAVAAGVFEIESAATDNSDGTERTTKQNMFSGKAHLLLAKWLDASGQIQAKDMTARYQQVAKEVQKWEKGHYYLGKHYNKLLEAEKALPRNKQSTALLGGEMTKLVVENLMRSIPFGNKYWHQSIPKVLTLWLDLGKETVKPEKNEDAAIFEKRVRSLQSVNKQLQKYVERIPAYVFYTALPQIISRIAHPHPDVWKHIANILLRIVSIHPSQALWSLLAVIKASERVRVERGIEILNKLKDPRMRPVKGSVSSSDLRIMITQGQRLSDGLLHACEAPVEQRSSSASLSRDLGFNHKLAPINLVVPIETNLSANLPSNADGDKIRLHKAFVHDKITIQSFSDDVLVLSSLQRPRKLTVRGSDGKSYGLLCKPKDDLRKDQRLMEFNGIINRALKRNAESSKRRLYIKTYAVTPLSEESGTIEWVEGIKPMRDILLGLYARKGIRPMYAELRNVLNEACASRNNVHLFQSQVLDKFPPILHQWFTELYPEPEVWFAARLRYARSAAVMSMTGHVLGLGDRHGENILLEEGSGGVFHVDFNCLFDKGLTFEKPELVPFRLTHNMVDAMGPYGYEGPFRKSSELTLSLLRQSKDTLMTVLETFLYDPTTDFVGKKKRNTPGVPETPQEILDSVQGKLKGLLRGETVPLSAEGYVDALIREAVSPANLCAMYIGWCAFL
ncbi:protein kinase rad3 [Acrodontium crateriforme]|uniref:Serine/threonine-protein kinase MEC1 n=1 Tax=Acrodontium crateriforme TaxID=150365 RepID=A0AAQ3M1H2_9PEZI|nr:protein kinase rad3 [Acrodontium crateriforme]